MTMTAFRLRFSKKKQNISNLNKILISFLVFLLICVINLNNENTKLKAVAVSSIDQSAKTVQIKESSILTDLLTSGFSGLGILSGGVSLWWYYEHRTKVSPVDQLLRKSLDERARPEAIVLKAEVVNQIILTTDHEELARIYQFVNRK